MDLPLMQPCSNVTAEKSHVAAYGTHRQVGGYHNQQNSSSYVSCGGSEECETIDSISLYSVRFERKREKGAFGNIVDVLGDVVAQLFDVFVISPEDIDCVADVIDEATQELAVELTVEKDETEVGFEEQVF
jgi:hypothetical protein